MYTIKHRAGMDERMQKVGPLLSSFPLENSHVKPSVGELWRGGGVLEENPPPESFLMTFPVTSLPRKLEAGLLRPTRSVGELQAI